MSNAIQNQYKPDYVSLPGETLEELLAERGMSQEELAEHIGISMNTISEIISGKSAITAEIALQLESVLGAPASFWNSRERLYREALARMEEQERLQNKIYNLVPSNNDDNMIQVVSVRTLIASYIVSYLSKYTAEVMMSGVKGIVIAIEETKVTINYTKKHIQREGQASYRIVIKENIAHRFSQAIDRAEKSTVLRESIKARLIAELELDLDEIFLQLRQELQKERQGF